MHGDKTTIAVNPIVIKMLEKLQAFYQLNGKKKSYGENAKLEMFGEVIA